MLNLRTELQEKEKAIIASVETGYVKDEFRPKLLKIARKTKVLSVRLNREYRILFRRGRRSWIYYATIHRKELRNIGKNL
ncbi:MAG: hypothetical protein CL693_13155 [Cellvibrionaceae bacterium]|nr:hypothetical protein [Cellvibrionaceae bacterium]|tara:strand:+ start:859 stop:1098 length:240 start_codon:yes stop_codon:yes gene_type:complete